MQPVPSAAVLWTIRLLSLAAAATTAYIWYVSDYEKSLPVGCGAESGCAAVLTSRWSSVAGVSVAALALALHATIFAASWALASSRETVRARAALALIIGAWLLIGAAIWFFGLQQVVLGATCLWCLASHALGVLLAIVILSALAANVAEWAGVWNPATAAMACLAVLMALQIYIEPQGRELHRIAGTAESTEEGLSLFDGKLVVDLEDVPRVGALGAPKQLALMFDYCCPHCRATHEMLAHAQERYPNQFVVLSLPTPMNAECNPHHDETEPRFKNACELARFSLAVWAADPAKFAEYDAWLFEPETPREVVEAQRKAEELVGQDAFADGLASRWVEAQLKRNVDAYQTVQAERIPVLAAPGLVAIVGRPDDEKSLFAAFEHEWALEPAPGFKPISAPAKN